MMSFLVDHINDDEEKKENTQFLFCFNLKKTQRKRTNSLCLFVFKCGTQWTRVFTTVRPSVSSWNADKHTHTKPQAHCNQGLKIEKTKTKCVSYR